jgi:hypothetical protein
VAWVAAAETPRAALLGGLGTVVGALAVTWWAADGTPAEPATVLTDYLLAALGTSFAVLLWWKGEAGGARRWWASALAAIAAAAALGGSSHALGDAEAGGPLWVSTLVAIGLAAWLLGMAAVRGFVSAAGARRSLMVGLSLELALYVAWVGAHHEFHWAVLQYGVTLAALLAVSGVLWVRRRVESAPWMAAAILVSFAAAAIQQVGLSPHPQFNHNDLYHVVQAVGLWLFYRAGCALPEGAGETA